MSEGDLKFDRCVLCGGESGELVAEVKSRPEGETDFGIEPERYHRRIFRCDGCGLFVNRHRLLDDDFYDEEYHEATYGDELLDRFTRIMSLPDGDSDNKLRVERVTSFLEERGHEPEQTAVLDVGSGLAVFGAELKRKGFRCECLEPDPVAAQHAVEHAGADASHAVSFEEYEPERRFHLVAFNKVLEHVDDPVGMLRRAQECLREDGVVYVELPDGDAALRNGGAVDREEFYIEHETVFGPRSIRLLLDRAGFSVLEHDTVHEPSDKYTVFAFGWSRTAPEVTK